MDGGPIPENPHPVPKKAGITPPLISLWNFYGCSVAKSCPTLCDSTDCSTPGVPVLHYLLEFGQPYVHWVDDVIQPSHLLCSPSPPALNLSQHQGPFPVSWLFTSGDQSIGASASVLPVNIQDWFPLGWTDWISLMSKELSRIFSKPQFKSINSLAFTLLYASTLTSTHDYWKNHSLE